MEAYRSGHNEAVLKTVWAHAHGGSNPSASARKKHTFVYQDNVCFFQRNLPLQASEIASL